MEARNEPLYKDRFTCPIFYRGTLEEKFDELIEIQTKIEKINSDKDIRPSERLLDDRGELEIEINRHLINGEKLKDGFMDYCLRHFAGSNAHIVNMKSKRVPSVFDKIPAVKKFVDYIAESKGQKILFTYDNFPKETGIINGKCEFHLNKSIRNLYVPVEQLFVFSDGKWNKGKMVWSSEIDKQIDFGNYLDVDSNVFFRFRHFPFDNNYEKGKIWTTDYSKEIYIGGQGPKETQIYVGNKLVDNWMSKPIIVNIPEKKRKVKFSSPFI